MPSGPVRTAVPCIYVCATVFSTSQNAAAAQDFSNFLLSRPAQAQLAQWAGGIPLRPGDAVPILQRWPQVQQAEDIASGASDLTAADIYGGEETTANQRAYDAVADAFSNFLAAWSAHLE